MLLWQEDLMLKREVELYNNIATSGDCTGRLQAQLQVYPSPRIAWDFESLGEMACEPARSQGKLKAPLLGSWFSIDDPYVSRRSWRTLGHPCVALGGNAPEAHYGQYGQLDQPYHSFTFYLPNGRFQETVLVGQGRLETYVRVIGQGETVRQQAAEDRLLGSAGRFVEVPLDGCWSIHLTTTKEALSWLDPLATNVGTLITTVGWLYHSTNGESTLGDETKLPTLTMAEAKQRLGMLSLFLSFANGGYIGPLYIVGRGKDRKFSATVLAYRVTPLEQLGPTWLTIDSDLTAYLRCLPTFDRMMSGEPWRKVFPLILIWYFQAIQPQSVQTQGKPWPVVANALGAALERLSVTILKRELNVSPGSSAEERIENLLRQVGITQSRGHCDTQYVGSFIDIRNNATHPRSIKKISLRRRALVLRRAIQWVEEVLLWRLGYDGEYQDRTQPYYASAESRYDLSTRESSW